MVMQIGIAALAPFAAIAFEKTRNIVRPAHGSMIPRKPAPDLIGGGYRFPACAKHWQPFCLRVEASAGEGRSEEIMLKQFRIFSAASKRTSARLRRKKGPRRGRNSRSLADLAAVR